MSALHSRRRAALMVLFSALCALGGAVPTHADDDSPVPRERTLKRARVQLSDSQRSALRRLEQDTKTERDRLHDDLRRLRRVLEGCYGEYLLHEERIRGTHKAIQLAQARLLEVTLDAQLRLRQILSAGQFADLQRALRNDDDDGRDERRRRRDD